MQYYISKAIDMAFDEAEAKVVEELKKEGFGILTEIDVQKTLKQKLGHYFRRYKILGACNPPYAYKALQLEDKIGVMLPCNVMLQELPGGQVEVSSIDPVAAMGAIENPELRQVAEEVRSKLTKVLEALGD